MEDRKQQSTSPRPSDSRALFTSSAASDFHLAAASADPIAFDPSLDPSLDFASSQALFPDQSFSAAVDPVVIGLDHQPASFSGLGFNTSSGLNDTSFDAPLFSSSADDRSYTDTSVLDPALLGTQVPQQSMTAATSLNHMATLAPTLHPFDGSPHGSPAMNHSPFQPPYVSHSRNSSLDPSSAAFPPLSAAEWGTAAFQGHRRTLSDAHSDVSSTHQSPYLQAADNFDQPLDRSPLPSQDPGMFQDVLTINHMSLSDRPGSYKTPSHSPRMSPQLMPVQNSPQAYPPIENYDVVASMQPQMPNMFEDPNMFNDPNMHSNQSPDPFNNNQVMLRSMPAQSEVMTPPEINIQLAPPSRQASFEPQGKDSGFQAQGLTPPERTRGRSSSDPSGGRQSTPARDTLSPVAAGVGSRSPSPSVRNRRSSTSSVPNRDYILDLADPTRPTSNQSDDGGARSASGSVSGGSGKKQKHPATFQCSLCPKRFTRAYNLRSHLRTHTDERPFVCSHCGKAFARQHDRKRHEGLHSGEKKFVCRGQLKNAASWGCGRRFARADALGRHFRSEAGRMCIKPLMDEEALEHSNMVAEAGAGAQGPDGVGMMPGGMPGQPGMMMMSHDQQQQYGGYPQPPPGYAMGPGVPMRLPQALLQQYPTLSGIWDTLPANGGPEDVEGGAGGDMNSRASFSSAGEYDDEELDMSGPQGGAYGWASDVGP